MNSRFFHYLKIVAAVHVGVVVVLMVVSGWRGFPRKKSAVMVPVEFVVEVPAPPAVVHEQVPENALEQESKQSREKPIERSHTKIRRKSDGKPSQRQLSQEEIRKLLAKGARAGDHTSIPGDDTRYFEIVRQTLYKAWAQPSAEEVGDAVAEVSIRLRRDGQIIDRNMERESGNAVMDASVMEAVNSVQRITGLSSAFLIRHEAITVSFKVE